MLKMYLAILIIFLFGFLWSTAWAEQYLSTVITYADKTLTVKGQVESVNLYANSLATDRYIEFKLLQLINQDKAQSNSQVVNKNKQIVSPLSIAVYWNQDAQPLAGQIWTLRLKTRLVQGYLNEGGFDSQRFAMANKSLLTARLINAQQTQTEINLRQTIVNIALPYIELFTYKDILYALAFGDRTQLSTGNKTIMLQTGVAHLMAISGLHIVLVALMAALVIRGVQFFIINRLITPYLPLLIGWLCAAFYAWLSGLNPPAMRAILALSIWLILRYGNFNLTAWQVVNWIIALLLLFDPLMILSESFWLSCYAVISLIFLFQWLPLPANLDNKKRGYLLRLLHLQMGLILLLLPIQLFLFQGVSSISLIANLIAIPIISFITLPIILLALIASLLDLFYLALGLWFIADQSLQLLFSLLELINLPWLYLSSHYYLLSIVGWASLIIFRTGYFRRYFVTITIMLFVMVSPFYAREQALWRIDMLDVGHGLAILIRQGNSAVLYDTGAKWENGSIAERVILPFLKWHKINLVGIIISHEHNDHIGGLDTLRKNYPDAWLMSSSNKLNNDYDCVRGNILSWQRLTFSVLWPEGQDDNSQNAQSCVIKITDGKYSLLLTGDLERQQELVLVLKDKQSLSANILQTPHHGSNTSSSYPFLNYVAPEISLVSAARYNPWQLPAKKTLSRYQDLGLTYKITARTGQISVLFNEDNWQLKTLREKIKPRWYHDWFGSLPNYE